MIDKLRKLYQEHRLKPMHGPVAQVLLAEYDSGDISKQSWNLIELIVNEYPDMDLSKLDDLRGTLMPFQREGVLRMSKILEKHKGLFLADDMGLGKTIQAIAMHHLLESHRTLVICPSAVKYNWRKEFWNWLDDVGVVVLEGRTRTDDIPPWTEVVICNYAIIKARQAEISNWQPTMMIVDEFHKIKNQKAQRSKAVREIAFEMAPDAPRLLLTGTPILNRPAELWHPLRVIDEQDTIASDWYTYMTRYCGAYRDRFGWNTGGATNTMELHEKLTDSIMVRRKKEEVLTELPDLTESTIPIEIDNWTQYSRAESDIIS